jgi:DNA polymerase-3 subunit epsilon
MDERRLIIFDVETTGTDKRRDQIIELCVQFGLEGGSSQTWRIRPSVAMSPGAQAVHGISMDDLACCPPFSQVAGAIRQVLEEAEVLVGYNLAFDREMLEAEFGRIGQRLDLSGKQMVDPFRLWQQCEPRSLQDAHRRFVGDEFSSAHSAAADVAATGRVLRGMMAHFRLPQNSWGEIARVCEPERDAWVGSSRHIRWDEAGRLVLGFGKHAGIPLAELASGADAGYLGWIAAKDFPLHVREICQRALEMDAQALDAWVRQVFGSGAQAASSGESDVLGDRPVAELARGGESFSGLRAHG